MINIPSIEPKKFMAGDSIEWSKSFGGDYLPSDGWLLKYFFVCKDGKFEIDAEPGEYENIFSIKLDPDTTSEYGPGLYAWTSFTQRDGSVSERHQMEQGTCEVLADAAQTVSGYDTRTQNRRILDAINAMIEGKAGDDISSYSIDGRSISLMNIDSLRAWRDDYASKVRAEEKQEAINRGEAPFTKWVPKF